MISAEVYSNGQKKKKKKKKTILLVSVILVECKYAFYTKCDGKSQNWH